MDKQSVRWLSNVPYVGKNADQELANTIAATPYFITLSAKEKQRLDYEMNIIKETATAKVFLFGRELLNNGSLGTTLQNEYKLLYNEQFILLCSRFLGLDYETAELYQRRIKNKEHENLLEMENLINKRYPGEGEKLFQYLKQAGCRMVSKSHLVARLYSDIEWLNE